MTDRSLPVSPAGSAEKSSKLQTASKLLPCSPTSVRPEEELVHSVFKIDSSSCSNESFQIPVLSRSGKAYLLPPPKGMKSASIMHCSPDARVDISWLSALSPCLTELLQAIQSPVGDERYKRPGHERTF